MDWFHGIVKWIDYHRYTIAGLAVAAVTSCVVVGCDITTSSVMRPGGKVTAQQLETEAQAINAIVDRKFVDAEAYAAEMAAAFDLRVTDIERQQEQREKFIAVTGGLATSLATGTFDPVSAIGSIFGLFGLGIGVGATADNLRKNTVIKKQKQQLETAT